MPQLRPSRSAVLMVTLALVFTACQADAPGVSSPETPTVPPPPPPPAPVNPSLGVVTISPAEGTILTATAPAHFAATLAYDFGTSSGGEITVAIVCTRNGNLTCVDAGILATVTSGTGTREVSVNLRTVPANSTVNLTFMLHPPGADGPIAAKMIKYQSSS